MNFVIKSVYLLLTVLLLCSETVYCQNQKDSLDLKLIEAAKEIMSSSKTCALITLDEEGLSRVRTMDPFDPEGNLTVWFGTNPRSRKVAEIENNPRVTLYYLDKDSSGYVTIHGLASIVESQDMKEKWWKNEWKDFYPNKKNDYVLIQVAPIWMEVVSESRGIIGDPVTWKPLRVKFIREK